MNTATPGGGGVGPQDLPPAGSIGLVRVEGPVGEAIRLAQFFNGDGFEDFEHAFVLYAVGVQGGTGLNEPQVIEAEQGGVVMSPLSKYAGRQVLWLPCPAALGTGVIAAAATYLGVPYSYADYFAVAAHRLDSPLDKPLREWVARSHHVICSQLAAACADKAGWNLVKDIYPGYVTPARLASLAPADQILQLIQ